MNMRDSKSWQLATKHQTQQQNLDLERKKDKATQRDNITNSMKVAIDVCQPLILGLLLSFCEKAYSLQSSIQLSSPARSRLVANSKFGATCCDKVFGSCLSSSRKTVVLRMSDFFDEINDFDDDDDDDIFGTRRDIRKKEGNNNMFDDEVLLSSGTLPASFTAGTKTQDLSKLSGDDDDNDDDLVGVTPWDEFIPKLNIVTLQGRIGNDPDPRYFDDGKVVLNLSLAVRRKYHPAEREAKGIKSGEEETSWFRLELWGRDAEYATKYITKGMRVGITGSLVIDEWKDRATGEDRETPKVVVKHLDILESRAETELRMRNSGNF